MAPTFKQSNNNSNKPPNQTKILYIIQQIEVR